jgi:hypothetical protein
MNGRPGDIYGSSGPGPGCDGPCLHAHHDLHRTANAAAARTGKDRHNDWLDKAQRHLANNNQRAAFREFDFASWNTAHVPGGVEAVIARGQQLRPKVTGRYERKWDTVLARLEDRVQDPHVATSSHRPPASSSSTRKPESSGRISQVDEQLDPVSVSAPKVEWDGRVSMPARWYETGEFGTIRIPHEDWGKWEQKLWVRNHVYGWNGLYYERCGDVTPLPAPVLWPNGNRANWIDANWKPGDPLPTTLPASGFDDGQPRYLDTKRNVYVTAAQMESDKPGFFAFIGGAIALCIYGFFVVGLAAMLLIYLWWLIIPVAVIAAIVWACRTVD